MKKYTIGLITGALLAVSTMMFMGSQNKNLGEITVDKITLRTEDKDGKRACIIQGGGIIVLNETAITSIFGGKVLTHNADGQDTAFLGTGEIGVGFLETYNADGKKTAFLGTAESGGGHLETYNAEDQETAYLGTGRSGGGHLTLRNGGTVETYNEHKVKTGYFGTDNNNDGMVVLFDRYGDVGWSASGKK